MEFEREKEEYFLKSKGIFLPKRPQNKSKLYKQF